MNEAASRWGAERSDLPDDYDAKWRRLAAAGESVHGEADFVCRYEPTTVLDAGCGTGRVAIELAARGVDVVGVDLDDAMLERARVKAPSLEWVVGDVEHVDLDRTFDVVVTAGNVMVYVRPGSERSVVANLARHVAPGGVLISGFQTTGSYGVARYDADCAAAGFECADRHASWDGDPWTPIAGYAVSVHERRVGST